MTSDQEMRDLADRANDNIGIQYSLLSDEWLLTCDKPTMQMLRKAVEWVPEALDRLDKIQELHRVAYDCANSIHNNPEAQCPECVAFCWECGGIYPCLTIQLLDRSES